MKKDQILEKLNEITSNYNFIYTITEIVIRDFCGALSELAYKNSQEHLNFNEVKFLMGLWIKNVRLDKPKELNTDVVEEVYELLNKLHLTFLPDISQLLENPGTDGFDFFNP